MSRLSRIIPLLITLLVVPTAVAKRSPIAPAVLEAKWQNYAVTAEKSAPAMQFPYEHCFQRAAVFQEHADGLLRGFRATPLVPVAELHAAGQGVDLFVLGNLRIRDLRRPENSAHCCSVEKTGASVKQRLTRIARTASSTPARVVPAASARSAAGIAWANRL